MSILDKALQMADAEAVTDTAKQIGDIIDLKKAGNGIPHNPHWYVQIDTAVTSAGAANATIDLQTSSDEAFTSPVTLLTSGAIAKADLGKDVVAVDLPIPTKGLLQYLRTYVTPSATLTAGKFDSYIGY